MENNSLQNIWKNIDSETPKKSKDELNTILSSKVKLATNRYLKLIISSATISIAFIIFLTFTSLNRTNDIIYLTNNIILLIITLIAFISSIHSWRFMRFNKYSKSLKEWLKIRIEQLSARVYGKYNNMQIYTIPFIYILTLLSIHVYFKDKLFIDVIQSSESIIALSAAITIGLIVSFFVSKRIKQHELKTLKKLESLYENF